MHNRRCKEKSGQVADGIEAQMEIDYGEEVSVTDQGDSGVECVQAEV